MKKFLRVRNIIIFLIVIVAIAIFLYMKQDDVFQSKTYNYLKNTIELGEYLGEDAGETINNTKEEYTNKGVICSLSTKDGKNLQTYANYCGEQMIYFNKEQSIVDNEEIRNDAYVKPYKSTKAVIFDYKNGKIIEQWTDDIEKIYGRNIKETDIDDYFIKFSATEFKGMSLLNSIYTSLDTQGYIRGFEFIEGKIMYFEHFKLLDGSSLKVYFENDEIKYLKCEAAEDYLLELKVERIDSFPRDWLQIPNDYKNEELAMTE
ncbi:MAG: hypothetical protein J5881_02840 [Clostridia bacterium]|nr:hypothetical protein [Clostridia bacterium]